MIEKFHSKHFTLEKVRDGIYAAIAKEGGGAVGNAGFVDLGSQTLVFDTFNTQQAAEDLNRMAIQVTKRPVRWVVNSHWHGDHIRGNQVFKESTIVSSQTTFEKMKEFHPARIEKQKGDVQGLNNYIESLKQKISERYDEKVQQQIHFLSEMELSLPTLELVLPQQTFSNEMMFQGSKRSAQLFTLGGGHSYCDAVLYIPEDKVAFMGDLLFVGTPPTFFDESNPENWIQILRQIEEMDIATAIPGHGPVGTKGDIQQVIEYIKKR
ncbi:MBL fold metallo-hydrolase [Neobacillus rhizosphaerae]|uniref:MBL fold metallo-hydrolase n=1 Tax=Neobacillus rhizosphaerae TaxID=2880965 RepID=UPI003D2B650C